MGKAIRKLLKGEKFGRLTVIKLDHIKMYVTPNGKRKNKEYYLFECECGNKTIKNKADVIWGNTKSCGCKRRENSKKIHTTHGKTNTRIFTIWVDMKQRCKDKNNSTYGGKGITYCQEWEQFELFYEWAIKNGYSDELTIDRIDVNGNYEPSNCRWSTLKEQANNRANNKIIKYKNEVHTQADWCRILNLNYRKVQYRLHNCGWNAERAFALDSNKIKKD